MAALGPASAAYREAWAAAVDDLTIHDSPWAIHTGRRAGSRVLGLGADCLRLALLMRARGVGRVCVSTNPWLTVALRLLRMRVDVTLGLYAVPGSRSWRFLRRVMDPSMVVAMSAEETDAWIAAGGRATTIPFGGGVKPTGPGRLASDDERLRIFCGGMSDRDFGLIKALHTEVARHKGLAVQLRIIGTGGNLPDLSSGDAVVAASAAVSPEGFSTALRQADVVFLPLKMGGGRAAGQMVLLEAVATGVAVLATPSSALSPYLGLFQPLNYREPLLVQLQKTAATPAVELARRRDVWASRYSMKAFASDVAAILRDEET